MGGGVPFLPYFALTGSEFLQKAFPLYFVYTLHGRCFLFIEHLLIRWGIDPPQPPPPTQPKPSVLWHIRIQSQMLKRRVCISLVSIYLVFHPPEA